MGCKFLSKYLLWFANENVDFRKQEINSIIKLFNLKVNFLEKTENKPYWIVELPSEEAAHEIASRSVTLRCIVQLWSRAKTNQEFHNTLKSFPDEFKKPYFVPSVSFKIKVETFCNSQTQEEKLSKIESFSYLPFEGPVKLKNPDVAFLYIEYYGMDSNNIPEEPYDYFFGRVVADGQRDLITKISLKSRKFIGNTSMDPQLSLLMANQALIKKGDIVYDPFVGSGSLLVGAAEFGAYVWGSDIDFIMLHGKSRPTRIQQKSKIREKDESIFSNFQQYGRSNQYLDVIVADASLPLWREGFQLDAIITDPPYGIREAPERIGSAKNYSISDVHLNNHIPSKIEYALKEIYEDLFNLAIKHLKVGKRLICWLPVLRSEYEEENLPNHPCFKLIGNSEQILSTYASRRLLTYEKTHESEILGEETKTDFSVDFRSKKIHYVTELRKQKMLLKCLQIDTRTNNTNSK